MEVIGLASIRPITCRKCLNRRTNYSCRVPLDVYDVQSRSATFDFRQDAVQSRSGRFLLGQVLRTKSFHGWTRCRFVVTTLRILNF